MAPQPVGGGPVGEAAAAIGRDRQTAIRRRVYSRAARKHAVYNINPEPVGGGSVGESAAAIGTFVYVIGSRAGNSYVDSFGNSPLNTGRIKHYKADPVAIGGSGYSIPGQCPAGSTVGAFPQTIRSCSAKKDVAVIRIHSQAFAISSSQSISMSSKL